jgi:hypothetical protein
MEKMWMRTVLALALCLSISACGKSRDDKAAPAPAPTKPADPVAPTQSTVPTPAATPTAPPPSTKDDNTNKDLKGNPMPGPGDVVKPRRLQEKPRNSDSSNSSDSDRSSTSGSNSTRSSQSHTSPSAPHSPAPGASTSSLPSKEFDGARYSGAGPDNLREYLTVVQDEDNSISSSQRALNLKFARSIKKASLRLNTQTGQAQMILSLTSLKGKETEIAVTGAARAGQSNFTLSSKTKGLSGKLMCLDALSDQGQTCQTSLGEVKYNNARVQVIFRHTAVEMQFDFARHNCLTKECSEIYDMSRYSERKIIDSNTLKLAVMDTFEVVQGKSEFRLLVVTNENEVMKFAGPLANPDLYPVLDTPVDRSLTAEDLRDPKTHEPRRSRLNEALNDVRITTNDGLGNLNLLVKMKLLDDGARDMFQIYLKRKVRDIQIPSENSLK